MTRTTRVLAGVTVGVLLLSVGCAKKKTTTPGASNPPAGPVVINVDSPTSSHLTATAYFPSAVNVHAGDEIDFHYVGSGEPHTATFGALVDKAYKAYKKNPDAQSPEGKLIPQLLPDGPGDAFQSAAQPCFLETGNPSLKPATACPKVDPQPEFTGKQRFYNSGWFAQDGTWSLTVATDAAPGTYNFICLLHGPDMHGSITVVPAATAATTAAEAVTKGAAELKKHTDALAAIDAKYSGTAAGLAFDPRTFAPVAAPVGSALAGGGVDADHAAQLNMMGPAKIAIKVGGSVTWVVLGDHSISFGAPEDAKGARMASPDGGVHVNVKAVSPAGGPGAPGGPPGDKPAPPKIVDAGKWDGTGFHSSGLFLSFPPALLGYKLTFTTAGSYPFRCLIHDQMEGTVTVA